MVDAWKHADPGNRPSDPRPGIRDLGKYSPKCVAYTNGDMQQCRGKYIILIDGSQDAAYTITQARWSSATAASAVPGDGNTSLAVEGSLKISEPKGVAFLDQVVKCSVALGVDASQLVYCLKTFFIGFTDDDTVEVISDIPPILFTTYDVTGSFTERGGEYEMLFVAVANGTSRLPQYSKAVNSMSIKAGSSLAETMKNLQDNIRSSYDRHFNCVYKQLEELKTPQAEQLLNSLCRVDYVIELSPEYQDSAYKVTDQPVQQKNKAGCDEESQITFPANTSIETAISTIMNMCPKVKAEMAVGKDDEQVRYEFKVHTCVKSAPSVGVNGEPGKLEYVVYYRVERFATPKSVVYNPVFQMLAQDDAKRRIMETADPNTPGKTVSDMQRILDSIIEFDYIYTGKNIDILEFDIKVNMGMAYLQTATLANTFKSQIERAPTVTSQPSAQDIDRLTNGSAVQTPVFFGKQIGTPKFLNTQNGSNAIQSAYSLAKHASLEVAEAEMTIIGNDLLLMSTNGATSPERMIAMGDPVRRNELIEEDRNKKHFPSWTLTPAFVKLNIKMPRNNDDFSLFSGKASDERDDASMADYAVDFWFDGYYYVYGIDHVFDMGEFKQTLHLLGIPKTSTFESTKTATKEASFDTKVSECYDSQIKCGSTVAPDSGTAPIACAAPEPERQLTPLDADTINSMQRTLAHVKGWKNASPAVQTAIMNAANQYGLDPVVLAQICYQESKFDPSAKNPRTSATGLFQFLSGTWAPKNGGLKPDSVLTPSVLSDKSNRLNPQLNAYGGAQYLANNARIIKSSDVGDLYLAHFMGPGNGKVGQSSAGAKGVIEQDERTNGTMTLAELVGREKAVAMAKANKPYIQPNMTVRDLRNWAKDKMAKTLIEPYKATPVTRTVPSSSVADFGRQATANIPRAGIPRASDKISAQQNCAAQEDKPAEDKKPCVEMPGKEFIDSRANTSKELDGVQTSDVQGA